VLTAGIAVAGPSEVINGGPKSAGTSFRPW
jgi:hypothetical protein